MPSPRAQVIHLVGARWVGTRGEIREKTKKPAKRGAQPGLNRGSFCFFLGWRECGGCPASRAGRPVHYSESDENNRENAESVPKRTDYGTLKRPC